MNQAMSLPHMQSHETLGENHTLPENWKQNDLDIMEDLGLCTGMISAMKDKSTHEPNTIGFLNQCKFELSAEVIRWKEENHKLRREKEMHEQKILELQSVLDSSMKRNEELEASLLSANQQFEKLKMHSIAINEENKFLHRKLSKTCSKYYSYPWSEFGLSPVLPLLNGNIHQLSKREVGVPKSWEEVSEKLIEQMKLEMKELQMLGQKLAINDLPSSESIQTASRSLSEQYVLSNRTTEGSDVEHSIVNLACDLELLKQHLKDQQQKLSLLLNRVSDCEDLATGASHHSQDNVSVVKKLDSVSGLIDWGASEFSERKFVRPSDDSFRAYFTQQLSNSKSTEELKCMLNFYVDSSKSFFSPSDMQNIPERVKVPPVCVQTQPKCTHNVDMQAATHNDDSCVCLDEPLAKPAISSSVNASKNCFPEEERVCPICEAVFPRVFSQKEFESHVVAHLEAGSASLLDQYEIL